MNFFSGSLNLKRFVLFASVVVIMVCLVVPLSRAKVVTRSIPYEYGGVEFDGYLAVDTSMKGTRPGVLIVHQWMGLGKYEKMRARQLAKLGYVAFAADVYGSDTRPETTHQASLASSTFREDRNLYRRRLKQSLMVLKSRNRVDSDRVAAIGYCFGGTGVLELARSEADVGAVVSFHGGLSNPNPKDARKIEAAVQVHHGAEDPHVTQEHVISFWNEMTEYASTDWQLNVYSDATHGFTESGTKAYNKRADRLSWQAMKRLFQQELRE